MDYWNDELMDYWISVFHVPCSMFILIFNDGPPPGNLFGYKNPRSGLLIIAGVLPPGRDYKKNLPHAGVFSYSPPPAVQ